MEVEEGLGFYDSYLVGVGVESVDVQLVVPCFKVNVAERLKPAGR